MFTISHFNIFIIEEQIYYYLCNYTAQNGLIFASSSLKTAENVLNPLLRQGVCCIRQMVVVIQLNGLAVVLFFSLDDFRLNRF